jgi:phage gp46-like protein
MADVVIRAAEGCDADPFLLWNSRWSPGRGGADWQLSAGGLASDAALETAITLALFTDRRVPADHPLAWLADGDPRGWWGDGVDVRADLYEAELGSLLWLLERAPLTFRTSMSRWAETFARDALASLLTQRAVVRIEVAASVDEIASRLDLAVSLFGRDGANVYDRKFELVWDQIG